MSEIEAISGYLAHLNESLAQCAEAVTAQSDAQEALVRLVTEMSDKLDRIEGMLGNFVKETEQLRGEARQLLRARG